MHHPFIANELIHPTAGRRQTVPPFRKAIAACLGALALFAWGLIVAPPVQATDLCSSEDGGLHPIYTETQLRLMATDTDCLRTGKTFTLVDNITLSGSWTPIGNATNKFKGTFDGNSKTISGLTMTFTSTSAVLDYGGLFGYAQDAIIKNITLTGVSIINDDRTILGPQYVGGIVGRADNTDVLNSSVTGSIDATNYVGGIAGHIANGSLVSNSSSAGSVGSNASLGRVGGIVGFASTSDLTDVTSSATTAVGAVGEARGSGIGGIVGDAYSTNITNAVASGVVTGFQRMGGLAGSFQSASPVLAGTFSITNSRATGNVLGVESDSISGDVGGLVGEIDLDLSFGDSAVTLRIVSSYAIGDVVANYRVGGLIGLIRFRNFGGAASTITVEDSYAAGRVTGRSIVGGLIGGTFRNVSSTGYLFSVSDTYATGAVTGIQYVGGLVGYNDGASVDTSYATGAVTGNDSVGGLIGESLDPVTATATYWNAQTTGYSFALGTSDNVGTSIANTSSLTTSQMRSSSSFSGWNFSTVWGYHCSTSVLPQLRAINTGATSTACPEPVVVSSPVAPPPITTPITTPTPPLGGSTMNLGGRVIAVSVQPTANNTVLTLNAGPVSMGLGGVTADGRPLPIGPGGVRVLSSPGQVIVNGSGLLPGSTVTQTLFSNPVALGSVAVDASGSFRASPIIPASVPLGNHTLSFTGTANTGEPFALSIGIRLQSQAAALGANPKLTSKPKRVQPGVTTLVTISAAQARCTVRFSGRDARAIQRTSKTGAAQAELRVPATQRGAWTVTARITGKGCDPVTTTLSVPVRR